MSIPFLGLDIGGANLKAATANGAADSLPFALWREPEGLGERLGDLLLGFPPGLPLAVTMTGELCDCFPTRRAGVQAILRAVEEAASGRAIFVWTTQGHFLPAPIADDAWEIIAAANWLASATFVGRFAPSGPALFFDIGSTTADLILLQDGKPILYGRTDPQRLRSGELVYTGIKRTPACALLSDGVCAEFFATAQDAYLRLGMIAEEPDCTDTADRRPATVRHAHARLARMLGGDGETIPEAETLHLASRMYGRQRELLTTALRRLSEQTGRIPRMMIAAGSGEFLAQAAWLDFAAEQTEPMAHHALSEHLGPMVSSALAAYAVAVLADEASGS